MKPKRILFPDAAMLLAAILCSSCATQSLMGGATGEPQGPRTTFTERLWEATSADNDVVEVPFDRVFEIDLVQSGLTYTKNEERGYYYIEGRSGERTKDRILRIIGTPVAVAADLCLGGIFLFAFGAGGAVI